ncbi:MAG: PEP-CTERM sorting domain-containing protein [Planctomycetaceae bacterium]
MKVFPDLSLPRVRVIAGCMIAVALGCFATRSAATGLVINVYQSGADVIASASGSINYLPSPDYEGATAPRAFVRPMFADIGFGNVSLNPSNLYVLTTHPDSYGPGGNTTFADYGSSNVNFSLGDYYLSLPASYTQGSSINATATYQNYTIAGLFMTTGTYYYTWGDGVNTDTATLIIGAPPAPPPGPTTSYWSPSSGLGGTQTWSTGPANTYWAPNSDGSGTKQTWNNGVTGAIANFGGTPGTVTVSGTVEANQLSFTTGGYTVAGSSGAQVSFIGSAPAVNLASGVSTTVTANLGGSGPLAVTGLGSRGTLALAGNATGSTGVQVTNALLSLSGTVQGNVSVAASAALGGTGRINGTISGAGAVAPGNSPGILTAAAVDPSSGLDFSFEFSGTAPNYANAGSSVNDVLRLTGGTPFTSALTSANTKTLFLNMTKEELGLGVVLKGAFFTDADGDFLSLINNAIQDNAGFAVYVKGDGQGTDNSYNGQGYYNWRNPAMFGWTQSLFASTSVETANFAGGTETGRVLTLAVAVPEPSTYILAGIGICIVGFRARRRRADKSAA